MCNFYGLKVSKIQFIRLKQLKKELGTIAALKELETFKDGFTYSNSVIVRNNGKNDIEVVPAKWEFTPIWIKDEGALKAARKQGIPWLNAKSETILESKMFREAALKRRCLVPASYFFEWRGYKPEGAKKENKYPYVIGVNDVDYFYLAGLYNNWTDKSTGENIDTFAIVTTQANELMQEVHNSKKRMPTILPENQAYRWIMEDLTEPQIKELASYQLSSAQMYAYTIPKAFKALEDPTTPFEYEEVPVLDIAL
jgi:putative SOS response-associated peptidase YedK